MVTIVTERLKLREFDQADWQSVHEYASSPEVTRFVGWGPNSEKDTKNFMQRVLASQLDKPRSVFELAVTLKEGNSLIGGCRISASDPRVREGSIGYLLHRNFWGHGYGTELSRALLAFGFEQLDLHRIYATCDVENTASSRILEKIGMQREGRLREYRLQGTKWRDQFLYAILDREWKSQNQTGGRRHGRQ
jgi:RimJ/RimL family protein N-acetyltransferase